ncbi:uncharacterized protein LOC106667033 [Cimex lectularius]|uniref:Uncharacterized protein n=1 Tax=Cimex lectularius TaxID=79782 RepID=A0A8I6RS85_CIMLE|nr:uncharacterized protein LOC106667033 [Cimex lectularius]
MPSNMREPCCDCYFKRKVADIPENAWCTGQIENLHAAALFSDCKASPGLAVEESTDKDIGPIGIRPSSDFMNVCVCTLCFEEINSICMPPCSTVQANPINYISHGYEIFKLSTDIENSRIKYYTQYGPGSANSNINNQHFCPLCVEEKTSCCSQKVPEKSLSLFNTVTDESKEPISVSKDGLDIQGEALQNCPGDLNGFNSTTLGLQQNENLTNSVFENDGNDEYLVPEENLSLNRIALVFENDLAVRNGKNF